MMQQYLATKKDYPDTILFYRLGDFYEMFFEDAVLVSKELELTLTGKSCGMPERAPMCGVPYHAYETYANRLIAKGYKVAICEQVEDPKLAKGLVKREVVRIITPGTNMSATALDAGQSNYICCVYEEKGRYALAFCELSTGYLAVCELPSAEEAYDEIERFHPSEILYEEMAIGIKDYIDNANRRNPMASTALRSTYFHKSTCFEILCRHFHVQSLNGLGLHDFPLTVVSCGALLGYLKETQKNDFENILEIHPYTRGSFMILDSQTRRNLELTETMRDKNRIGSLLWVLDKTKTAMGARRLKNLILQPFLDVNEIVVRQDAVAELIEQLVSREELREYLQPVYDLERLMGRITYQNANPRDLLSFASSLRMLPPIISILRDFHSEKLLFLAENMDPLTDLCDLILQSIDEEAPLTVREGNIIKTGFHPQVDELRSLQKDAKSYLSAIEEEEKERTGIKNLRIRYNKVFGYYLEVTNSYLSLVPEDYIRKQTLTNAERFITPKLKELEDKILSAEERLWQLEYELFCNVRDTIAKEVIRIEKTAHQIADLDVFLSLAHVADKNHYVRPQVDREDRISVEGGRHPVVEQMTDAPFIDNPVLLDENENRINIITGPNMAGKSTYMRQVALLCLMAQIGSYVPATSAKIGICDRIFTRVGASDDLATGQSTFMMEMNEVANILRNATKNSLIILDEIGRGTSTYDGLAIAWAVIEHISTTPRICAKTLFATHYHELTQLEGRIPHIKNYRIAVREEGEDVVFLRKIVPGGADKSYGIQVAKLAGVPADVIHRAKEIALEISEQKEDAGDANDAMYVDETSIGALASKRKEENSGQEKLLRRLRELSPEDLSPLEALHIVYELKDMAENE